MTMTLGSDQPRPLAEANGGTRRGGCVPLVLAVAAAVVAAAVGFMWLGRAQAQPYILGLLALLAMVGLFALFAFAAGIVRFADRSADDPLTRSIGDSSPEGIVVVDSRGHVAYSNRGYRSEERRVGKE